MELKERDYRVLKEVSRWRYMYGRHITKLLFPSQSTATRRIRALVEAGYLKKKHILYGQPPLYIVAHKGRVLIGANKREDKINMSLIAHNTAVLDTVVYFHLELDIKLEDITSEKELHIRDGFSERKHQPDFIYRTEDGFTAVEVELTLKSEDKLHNNIKTNFLQYEGQIWVVEKRGSKIERKIEEVATKYPDIRIMYLSDFYGEDE